MQLWRSPIEGLKQFFRDEAEVESLLVGMSLDAAKALGECFGIAVFTTGTDLYAAAYRVPSRVGPFDVGVKRHYSPGKSSWSSVYFNASSHKLYARGWRENKPTAYNG